MNNKKEPLKDLFCYTWFMSKYGIIAIHGGSIEFGTSEIARAIAGNNFPLYINGKGPHITSTKFRNSEVQKILDTCEIIISIHGVHDSDSPFVMMGGLDNFLIKKISESLLKNKFILKTPSDEINGDDSENICNLGVSKKGIQLEISRKLRDELVNNKNLLYLCSQSIRNVLLYKYERKSNYSR